MLRNTIGILIFVSSLIAQTELASGVSWYDRRAEGHVNGEGQPDAINRAIELFSIAQSNSESSKSASLYLLKAHYFRGKLVYQDKEKKKEEFNKGVALGLEMMEKYPDDVDFQYWYLVNLGSWSEVYGILAAAKKGVADQMKEGSEFIIDKDPSYNDGSGYFMLGAVHFKSPYIPFLLSWPDNDEAVKYLQLAVDTGLATPVQKVYLAKALKKTKQKNEAIQLLQDVLATSPREDFLLEDLDEIAKAKVLLKKYK